MPAGARAADRCRPRTRQGGRGCKRVVNPAVYRAGGARRLLADRQPDAVRPEQQYRSVLHPGEIIYGKTETRALPHTGQRLRVGATFSRAPCSATRKPSTCALSCRTPAGWWTSAIRAFCRTCFVKGRGGGPGRAGRRAAYHRPAGTGQAR